MSCSATALMPAAVLYLLVWPSSAWELTLGRRDGGPGPGDDGGGSNRGPGGGSRKDPPGGRPSPPDPAGPPGAPAQTTAPAQQTTIVISFAPPVAETTTPPATFGFSTIKGSPSATLESIATGEPSPFTTPTGAIPDTTGTALPTTATMPAPSDLPPNYLANMTDNATDSGGGNRTLIITLSTVLSVVFVLIIASIFIAIRYRQKRYPFARRGISPIDDDEIETWKTRRPFEKDEVYAGPSTWTAAGATIHSRRLSGDITKPPPGVIVYRNPAAHIVPRASEEFSPRSFASTTIGLSGFRRPSTDKEPIQPPVQARAPNSRAGLTDETIAGEPSFIRRQPSRLSKLPPRSGHTRTRSSRSSGSVGSFNYTGSELELQVSPRESTDFRTSANSHSRIYSSSSVPPRLSLGDEFLAGGLSPRPLLRDDIGLAIG